MRRISIEEKGYPEALRVLEAPPRAVSLWRELEADAPIVAIVGTRSAAPAALEYTRTLAAALAREGAIVISGGAFGIDRAAHEGALAAGGRTWLFAPCGIGYARPDKNRDLYDDIKASDGSNIVSVFGDDEKGGLRWMYFKRNEAMVAFARDVVCVQAGLRSGATNTMKYARKYERRRWVAMPHPFVGGEAMRGCELEHERGAHVIPYRMDLFVAQLVGKEPVPEVPLELAPDRRFAEPSRPLEAEEERVLSVLTTDPRHTDEIAEEVGLSAPNVATALLTLALEDVVVEGPGGFFRRK